MSTSPIMDKLRRTVILSILLTVMFAAFALDIFADEVIVTRHAVLREGAGSLSPRIATAEPGERFRLLSNEPHEHWYLIEYQSKQAWVYAGFVDIEVDQPANQSITIASFNTLHLGWNNNKDYTTVASILSDYDIVALQEVMSEDGIRKLVDHLNAMASAGTTWQYIVSDKIGRSSYKECYGFVWRDDRVAFINGSDYVYNDIGDNFSREPYIASFKSGNFDFTLISAHFIYGDRKADRQAEAQAVAGLFNSVRLARDEKDILLMGDYNLSPDDNSWYNLKNLGNIFWILNPPVKTSIGKTSMSELYDNIWFQENYVREYAGQSGANEFMHDLYDEDHYLMARDYISDHVPIYAVFRTDLADDD